METSASFEARSAPSPYSTTRDSDRGASPPERGLSLRLIRLWRKWACALEWPANWTSGANTWKRCEGRASTKNGIELFVSMSALLQARTSIDPLSQLCLGA